MTARTRLDVPLYVHCMTCINLRTRRPLDLMLIFLSLKGEQVYAFVVGEAVLNSLCKCLFYVYVYDSEYTFGMYLLANSVTHKTHFQAGKFRKKAKGFWNVAPCRLVKGHQKFEGVYYHHLQSHNSVKAEYHTLQWNITEDEENCVQSGSIYKIVFRVAVFIKLCSE
jgi:hypothetical protein